MQDDNRVQEGCSNVCCYKDYEMNCENDISCFKKIAGTLTGEEIQRHKLVIPENNTPSDCVQATTYDLTLGEGHYVYKGNNTDKPEKWSLFFIGDDERLWELNKQNPDSEQYKRFNGDKPRTLVIPPYGSAFIQMNETVDTYTVAKEKNMLVVGRFDLKLSQVHQGLISQQATQVEPCYKGKLFCFIHNLSNQSIELKYGDKVATIEFSYVSCFCNEEKRKEIINKLIEKNREKYQMAFCSETGIDEIRHFHMEEKLPDDSGLLGFDDRIKSIIMSEEMIKRISEEVDKKVEKQAKWIPIIGVVLSFITAIIGIIWNTNIYNDKLEEVKSKMKDQQEIIETVQSKIEQYNEE